MKTKLVLWGNDANDEKILIAMQLHPEKNLVSIWTFPEKKVTEEFAKAMMNDWRNDVEVAFLEDVTHVERELTVSESLLPDDIKTERTDIIQRAQTEWHFIVLSSKLNDVYQGELADLKEKITQLSSFDGQLWDELKGFWSKVLGQVRDRNLFREHINSLRDNTNLLFERLKVLRSALDDEFKTISKKHFEQFHAALEDLEQRVKSGVSLTSVFNELKDMQRGFRNTKMTREHKSKIWEKLDNAFKDVKERKFGPNANKDTTPVDRLSRRYDGLLAAIGKMNRSIGRDREDLVFENRKVASSDGQLEAQIRQAKIKMIEERIRSKEEKLGEMNDTKIDLEGRLSGLKEKEARRKERDKLEQAKVAAKAKIKEEMKKRQEAIQDQKIELDKAAQALQGKVPVVDPVKLIEETSVPKVVIPIAADPPKVETVVSSVEAPQPQPKEESMVEAITATLSDSIEDVVDTVKAVADVLGDKISEKFTEIKTNVQAAVEPKEETTVVEVVNSTIEKNQVAQANSEEE